MIAIDQNIKATNTNNAGSVTTASFSTTTGNQLLLAFITNATGAGPLINTPTGAGLTWVQRLSTSDATSAMSIYSAHASAILSGVTVTATGQANNMLLNVISFTGADGSGTNGSGAVGATGTNTFSTAAPSIALTTTRANSWVWALGVDSTNSSAVTAPAGQRIVNSLIDGVDFASSWVQQQILMTSKVGTVVTMNDTAPAGDSGTFGALEILPAMPSFKPNSLRPHPFSPGLAR